MGPVAAAVGGDSQNDPLFLAGLYFKGGRAHHPGSRGAGLADDRAGDRRRADEPRQPGPPVKAVLLGHCQPQQKLIKDLRRDLSFLENPHGNLPGEGDGIEVAKTPLPPAEGGGPISTVRDKYFFERHDDLLNFIQSLPPESSKDTPAWCTRALFRRVSGQSNNASKLLGRFADYLS